MGNFVGKISADFLHRDPSFRTSAPGAWRDHRSMLLRYNLSLRGIKGEEVSCESVSLR